LLLPHPADAGGPVSVPVHDHAAGHLEHISPQISAVLDPLAVTCRGRPVDQIRPLVAAAWHRAFGAELSAMAVADTAVALCDGRPWCEALWITGW
jgi:hypothetical protein